MAINVGDKVKLVPDEEGKIFNSLFDSPYQGLVGVVKSKHTSLLGRSDYCQVEFVLANGKKKHPQYHETVLVLA